ncbi:MAG: methyltransferase domain-containing protein [Myxococcota bacterium]
MAQRGITEGLNDHEAALSAHQLSDFRSLNLFRMVAQHVVPGTVMDVGAGGGGMVAWLLRQGYDARGIDLSPSTAAAAARFLESLELPADRVQAMGLSELIERGETHDNVLSMDCIEHIEDDRTAFHQLVQLTRPGGRIIVTVPALMALYGARDETQGHYRRYERKMLEELAANEPIRIDTLRYWNLLGVAPTFINQRILGRAIDESFRYGKQGLVPRLLRRGLATWFSQVENRIVPPVGLTLLMTATRL